MFHNPKLKYIYLANPKTGTVTIHDILHELSDHKYVKNHYYSSDDKARIFGHSNVEQLKRAIPESVLNGCNKFTFIRDPQSKVVSAYHFYKQHKRLFGKKNIKWYWKLAVFPKIVSAKILPFQVWALIYPFKVNKEYTHDKQGNIFVNIIGRMDYFEEDLRKILTNIGHDGTLISIPKKNKSEHQSTKMYFENNLFNKLFYKKFKKEFEAYNELIEKCLVR